MCTVFLFEAVTKDTEVIVIYVVGHGIAVNGNARLLLRNATTWNNTCDEKSVEVNYLLNELLNMKSSPDSFVLIMNDFCRSAISCTAQQEIAGTQPRWMMVKPPSFM